MDTNADTRYVLRYALRRALRVAKYAAIGGVIAFLGAGILGTVGSGLAWFAAPGVFGGMGLGIAWATIKVSKTPSNQPAQWSFSECELLADSSSAGATGQSAGAEAGGQRWSTEQQPAATPQKTKRKTSQRQHSAKRTGEYARTSGCAPSHSGHNPSCQSSIHTACYALHDKKHSPSPPSARHHHAGH